MDMKFDYNNFLIMVGENMSSISHHFFPKGIMLSRDASGDTLVYAHSNPPKHSSIQYGCCTANVLGFVRKWSLTGDFLDSDPLPQPGSLGIAKCRKRVGRSLFLCTDTRSRTSLDSLQIAEPQGALSQLCVEVTGRYSNPDSLIPR